MRHGLRSGGEGISFFFFQDIITCLIGIVLFIALLLTLFAGENASENRTTTPGSPASADQKKNIGRARHLKTKTGYLSRRRIVTSTISYLGIPAICNLYQGRFLSLPNMILLAWPTAAPLKHRLQLSQAPRMSELSFNGQMIAAGSVAGSQVSL